MNPTIDDFIIIVKKMKKNDLLKEYLGKKLLIDSYKPFVQFIIYKTIKKYIKKSSESYKDVQFEINLQKVSNSIEKIRNKFFNQLEGKKQLKKI